MRKIISILLLIVMVLPIAVACSEDETVDPQFIENGEFKVKFGSTEIAVSQINSTPEENNIVVYTRDYKRDGIYSFQIGEAQEGRTALSVRCLKTDDGYEYDIVERTEDVASAPIPVNGFAISVPTSMLDGVRANKGQLVKVEGYELIVSEYERHDLATIAPDYLVTTASRRISMVNPVNGFVEDKIYYVNDDLEQAVDIGIDNVVVAIKIETNYSCSIQSIETKDQIPVPENGCGYFIFTGEYNIAYANWYFNDVERISFSMIDRANSYSDGAAVVIDGKTVEFDENTFNVETVVNDGVYVFDNNYSAKVTPVTDKKRVDVVIVNGYVVSVADENARTLIPDGNGFVITLVGDENINLSKNLALGNKIETCYIEYGELPEQYIEINNNFFAIDSIDGARAPEGVTVLYTPYFGKSTGTNNYGTEIIIVDGTVTEIQHSKGDAAIPENGYVLSIHKDSKSTAYVKDISVGDAVEFALTGSEYSITELKYDAENQVRNENTLIVYNNKTASGTNEYGYEFSVDKDGYAVQDSYDGNLTIPQGGFVLSGHGVNKTALEKIYAVGEKVLLDKKNKTVYIIKTPELKLLTAKSNFADVSDRLEAAKKAFYSIDYTGIQSSMSLIENLLKDAETHFDNYEFDEAFAIAESVISTCQNLVYSMIESKGVENRAVWYRSTEKSDDEVRATVEKMKLLNVNAVYLETWYEGNCIGSKVDIPGISTHAVNEGYDALDGFVRICHEYGIEVHCWVHNFFVGYYYDDGRNYYNTYFDEYKDKYLIDCNGRDFFYYSANNNKFIFLNSNDRECRDLILNIYEQLITKYDVDGLHLDYIRYPELNYGTDDFGYNQDIIDAFAEKTGITKDPRTFVDGSNEMKQWIQFRCDIITSFAGEVYDMVWENNPDIWLSAATYPDIELSKNTIAQDVATFAETGYFDEIFSMSYGVSNETVLVSVNDYVKITNGKTFYSAGIAAFLETTQLNFAHQLTEVELAGADGVSVFALGSISPDTYQWQIIKGAFRDSAVQVYKLSESTSAQMDYISTKIENISCFSNNLSDTSISYMKEQCNTIKTFADGFDFENATVSQKIAWCNNALTKIAAAKSDILSECGDSAEIKAVLSDFEDLEYWLTLTLKRLETRK